MGTRSKIKILHLLSQRPDSTGSGIYIQAMLREAIANGHHNYLIAGIQSNRSPDLECIPEDRCTFVAFGGEDISFPITGMSDVMPYASRCFSDLNAKELIEYENCFAEKILESLKKFKPHIIHSHHLWILTSLARSIAPDLPVVTTCHGSDLRQFQKCVHLQKKVMTGCSRLDAVMALSIAQKEEIAHRYHLPLKKIHVVGAGYNDRLFCPSPKPAPPPVQLIYAGKLSHAKGVPWLLRALLKIDSHPWRLHLVGGGSGEEKQSCLKLAGQLGDRVKIHGTVNQPELAAIMKKSHIFILPSFYEGLPLVILEALACSCRVIATTLPGVKEIAEKLQTRYINLVQTPRLYDIDTPVEADEKVFEDDLKQTLESQIALAITQPRIDLNAIADKMASFSWAGVFKRVEGVYFNTLENLHAG